MLKPLANALLLFVLTNILFSCSKDKILAPDNTLCWITEVRQSIRTIILPDNISYTTVHIYPYFYDAADRLIKRTVNDHEVDSLVYVNNQVDKIYRLYDGVITDYQELEYNDLQQVVLMKKTIENFFYKILLTDSLVYNSSGKLVEYIQFREDIYLNEPTNNYGPLRTERETYSYDFDGNLSVVNTYRYNSNQENEEMYYGEEIYSNYTLIKNPHYQNIFSDLRRESLYKYLFQNHNRETIYGTGSTEITYSMEGINEHGYPLHGLPTYEYSYNCED